MADFVVPRSANQHLRNPSWPPHAKFHDAQYVAIGMMSSAHGLRVLLRRGDAGRSRFYTAATSAAVPWLGMLGATLFPGTALSDPEFEGTEPKVLGMHPQLAIALAILGGISGVAMAERIRSRTR